MQCSARSLLVRNTPKWHPAAFIDEAFASAVDLLIPIDTQSLRVLHGPVSQTHDQIIIIEEQDLWCAAGTVTDAFADFVVGHGELWCAQLFAATVRREGVDAAFMDTRDVLVVTCPDGKSVDVEYAASEANLDAWGRDHGVPQVLAFLGGIKRQTLTPEMYVAMQRTPQRVRSDFMPSLGVSFYAQETRPCRMQTADTIQQGCISASQCFDWAKLEH